MNTEIVVGHEDLIKPSDIIEDAEKHKQSTFSENLRKVLATRERLRAAKVADIRFSDPILKHNDNPVIFPHTINVIQGQAGVHKSRLAESMCAALLKLPNCENELLGFSRTCFDAVFTVVYVDTERNLSEQLPYALQSLQIKAGYRKTDHPVTFEYISLLEINRKERFKALNEYLEYIKQKISTPLFVVLDVSTDCIEDFNQTSASMELIDLMNIAINEHNVIFLCLIHENPKSDKARGHFGTELMNKASTVIQVGFEKDAQQNDTDMIRVRYLKCRSTARHAPFHIKYCNQAKGLVLADAEEYAALVSDRKKKATADDVKEVIEELLGDGAALAKGDVLPKLCKDFEASRRTIEDRLKEMIEGEVEMLNHKGEQCHLFKDQVGKRVHYKLVPIKVENE